MTQTRPAQLCGDLCLPPNSAPAEAHHQTAFLRWGKSSVRPQLAAPTIASITTGRSRTS